MKNLSLNNFIEAPLYLDDLEDIDPQLLHSLRWMLDNSVEGIGQNFTYEVEGLEGRITVPLKPDGANIELTDDNKREFVRLLCQRKMTDEIGAQIRAFKKGFRIEFPEESTRILSPGELEHIISGEQVFDVAVWKKTMKYDSLTKDDNQAKWFWEILESFDQAELSQYIHFVSGNTKSL